MSALHEAGNHNLLGWFPWYAYICGWVPLCFCFLKYRHSFARKDPELGCVKSKMLN